MAKIKLTKTALEAAQPQAEAVAIFIHYVHTEDKLVRDAADLVASRRQVITGARRTEPAEAATA
jgi:hypothetical protein